MERSTQLTRPEGAAALEQQTVHTSEDCDRTIRVGLQNDLVVQRPVANTPEDVRMEPRGPEAGQARLRRSPVFRCIGWRADDAARRSSAPSRISSPGTERTTELALIQNGFLIETGPGFPSLELANPLADQSGLLISSPNWWTEVETT